MNKIVGIKYNEGSFLDKNTGENIQYSNYYIFSTYDSKNVVGLGVRRDKVLLKNINKIVTQLGLLSVNDLIGIEYIDFYCDRYGNIVGVLEDA